MSPDIREGFRVKFECGHTMVYDKHSGHSHPIVGELGLCRQCRDEYGFGVDRTVIALRQCWIETTTRVHFVDPRCLPTSRSTGIPGSQAMANKNKHGIRRPAKGNIKNWRPSPNDPALEPPKKPAEQTKWTDSVKDVFKKRR